MSNEDFLDHVKAAYDQGATLDTESVLTGENCTPEAYYEVMTQQLEAKIARDIYTQASGESDIEKRNAILDAHKKTYTAMVVGLGDYVVSHTSKTDLAEHCSHPEDNTDAYENLRNSSDEIFNTGVYGYFKQLKQENAAKEQENLQEQPKNEVKAENEVSKHQQEINPFVKI